MPKESWNGYDVIVVGVGPSGCASALKAKMMGLSVMVLESRRMENIIDEGKCSFEALQNLTQEQDAIDMMADLGFNITPVQVYERALVHGPFGTSVDFSIGRPHGYFVRRKGPGSLDQQMVGIVEDAGIPVLFGSRVSGVREDGSVEFIKGGHHYEARGETIIGADGRSTVVGKGIVNLLGSKDLAIGMGYHFRGPHGFEPGTAECWLGSRLCPGEYSYALASEDEVTIVTTMRPHLLDKDVAPGDHLKRLMSLSSVKVRLKGTKLVSRVRGCVPVGPGGIPGKGRILLAGDAGRLTDPLLGFGIKNAVRSGHLAGLSASGFDPLVEYGEVLEVEVLKDLRRRMSARSRIADRLEDRTIEDLLKVAASILDSGDPALFFDPERRWKEIWRTARKLPRKSDLILALRFIVPILATNFSFGPSRSTPRIRDEKSDMGSIGSDIREIEGRS